MTEVRLERSDWLREGPLVRVLAALDGDGEEARVVGGAVRNALLGEPLADIDIATTALPDEVVRRAQRAGFKPVPTGIEHGTVTIVAEERPFEVTTLREDVETFGRKAKVVFGRDWKRDAARRDFTMNALTLSRDGVVHDEVGGLPDLKARRVRFIGDPATRIAEDYLRILRFFRFHAAYGEGPPDREGIAACVAAREGLDLLSRERVRAELLKLLIARHAVPMLVAMSEHGLLVRLLGGVPLLASFGNMIKLEAAMELPGDAVRRLGALAVHVPEDAERLSERLRLSNAESERLESVGRNWWQMDAQTTEREARTLLYRLGADRYADRCLLAWSRSPESATDARWHGLASLPLQWTVPDFPLKAADFMGRGIEKGPALGAALKAAEEAWIAADFPASKAELEALALAAIGS